ncbi:MAG: hypothetical protein LBS83_03305 [Holosporales bacterium]|jgi:hypothetical protein|nr:hypothetical protein [Holosporales bacterium]
MFLKKYIAFVFLGCLLCVEGYCETAPEIEYFGLPLEPFSKVEGCKEQNEFAGKVEIQESSTSGDKEGEIQITYSTRLKNVIDIVGKNLVTSPVFLLQPYLSRIINSWTENHLFLKGIGKTALITGSIWLSRFLYDHGKEKIRDLKGKIRSFFSKNS